jgi:hypothetical protein
VWLHRLPCCNRQKRQLAPPQPRCQHRNPPNPTRKIDSRCHLPASVRPRRFRFRARTHFSITCPQLTCLHRIQHNFSLALDWCKFGFGRSPATAFFGTPKSGCIRCNVATAKKGHHKPDAHHLKPCTPQSRPEKSIAVVKSAKFELFDFALRAAPPRDDACLQQSGATCTPTFGPALSNAASLSSVRRLQTPFFRV